MNAPRAAAVVLAAGSGTRVGHERNKVLLPVLGVPTLAHSVRTVLDVEGITRVVLVCRAEDRDEVQDAVTPHLGRHDLWLVEGGPTRHDSEWEALQPLAEEVDAGEIEVVAVHDAARPLATPALWRAVVDAAARHGGALPVTRPSGVVGRDGRSAPVVAAVQTPQAFRAEPLLAAYRQAAQVRFTGTDTASCLERFGFLDGPLELVGVPSGPDNLKVTFPEDLALAEELLGVRPDAAPPG